MTINDSEANDKRDMNRALLNNYSELRINTTEFHFKFQLINNSDKLPVNKLTCNYFQNHIFRLFS